MIRFATLVTCHNRCNATINCIQAIDRMFRTLGIAHKNFIVLDNCVDDTKKQLEKISPSSVLLDHSGNDLYWAGGMRYGYEYLTKTENFDYLLCFNDDVS